MTIDAKVWTPENVMFDSKNPKISYQEKKGITVLPTIYPLELEDPSRKELRYNQKVTNWLIKKFNTRLYGEGIIGCGKTEAGEELEHLFPSLSMYKEKVDADVFLAFYMDMMLHGPALQPFLAHERKELNKTVGEFTDPSYKDRSPIADIIFAKLLGVPKKEMKLLEEIIASNPYKPHMIYLFDCSVDTALKRIETRAEKDFSRKFEIPLEDGRLLTPDEIASCGRGLHKLIDASQKYRDPESHNDYLKKITEKGMQLLFKPQGVSEDYLQALHEEYSHFDRLCQKFKLENVIAHVDVNKVNVKDDRYHLALVYALKYGRCINLIKKGFTIDENRTEGYFRVISPNGKIKEFRPEYQ